MHQPVRYHFSNGMNAIFEIPTETVRRILPAGVEPIESNHGVSLIGFTLFDFSESPIGPYHELVVSVYAVPRLGIMDGHPHAAVYPIVVASSSQEARDHAIDLWKLPHFMEDISIVFAVSPDGQKITGTVRCHKGETILELSVRQTGLWKPTYQLYQSFQRDESGLFVGIMDMKGQLSEHEDNTGTLRLQKHRFFDRINLNEMEPWPVREMWMKDGVESYHELVDLQRRGEQMMA